MLAFIISSIRLGMTFLFGSTGETITEKSGHLNLGIPGVMCVGASCGCFAEYLYLTAAGPKANYFLAVFIPVLATLVGGAFNSVFSWGDLGEKFIAIAMFLFAFTTVLGWSHYGSKAWEYLFGAKTTFVFRIIHVCTVIFGAVLTSSLAWDISDTFNGLMMIPNLIAVVILSPVVLKITRNYLKRVKKGENIEPMYNFDPKVQAEEMERELED